jgi:hypothetical protein
MLINDEADLCMAIDVNDMDHVRGNPDFVIYHPSAQQLQPDQLQHVQAHHG